MAFTTGGMPAFSWLLICLSTLHLMDIVQAVTLTRQGEVVSCSLLTNSATAIRSDGSLQTESAPITELSQLLVRFSPVSLPLAGLESFWLVSQFKFT